MLVKEYELINKEHKSILEVEDLSNKFLTVYEDIKKYEKENKLFIMLDKVKEYINALKHRLESLENYDSGNIEHNEIKSFLKKVKSDFEDMDIRVNTIYKNDSESSEDEIIEEILLNLKYKLLPTVKDYKETLSNDYIYLNELRIKFGVSLKENEENFLSELKTFLEVSVERISEKINVVGKNILNEIKLTAHDDIDLEVVNIIKDEVLELNTINKGILNIFLKYENKINVVFLDILNNLGIEQSALEYKIEEIDYNTLNKRFFKLIEHYNKGFLKNKILIDIEKFIGHENIKNKLEIELLYALDFIKDKYSNNIENLILISKEKLEEIIYSNFEDKYGNVFFLPEQIETLENIYRDLKNKKVNSFNEITLIDYLNNSKKNKKI